MNPRLIVVSGTFKGTVFGLTEGEVSVGREAANSVCLNDPSVSRRHCLLRRSGNKTEIACAETEAEQTPGPTDPWTITDLESFNGTFVNDVPIKEQVLAHGDQITIGDVILLFVVQDISTQSTAALQYH